MKRPYILAALVFSICLCSSAQTITFQKTFGGEYHDRGYSVQQTADSGYIIAGFKSIDQSSGAFQSPYLVKTDADGDTLWTRTIGGGFFSASGYSAQQTTDGGYIIAGGRYCPANGCYFGYLIRTDASGDTLWTRSLTQEGWICSVQQTTDGGYIFAGGISWYPWPPHGVYLIRTDADGNTLWTKTIGDILGFLRGGFSVRQTSDGGYVIAGYAGNAGGSDVYLVKTDADGDTLWTKAFGGSNDEQGYSVQQTADGGYAIAGYTYSFGAGGYDVYLIRTDANGDTLWTRTFGGNMDDKGYSVQQTTDRGYIIAGYTSSFGAGGSDAYLIRTDANGDTLWTRTFGGSNDEEGHSVQETIDGGYVVAGFTDSFGPGGRDAYLIKVNASGVVSVVPPEVGNATAFALAQNYPNPFNPSTKIVYRVGSRESVSLKIYDVLGREIAMLVNEVKQPGSYEVMWDAAGVSSGVYFYRLTSGSFSETKRLVVLR